MRRGSVRLLRVLLYRERKRCQAVSAFSSDAANLGFPATPERVQWAVEEMVARVKKQEGWSMHWDWAGKLAQLLPLHPSVILVTLVEVRGHAPQQMGAKMIVTPEESFGTIGGGNLEKSALEAAKKMLAEKERIPRLLELRLNPAEGEWGAQCCGGEVLILLEPLFSERKQVALFGAGHVGLALAQILSLLPIDLYVVDSRPERLAAERLAFPSGSARFLPRGGHFPERVVGELARGAHLVIATHDHVEDLAILEAALARSDLGFLGLIGSSVKWAHFQRKLRTDGIPESALQRVTTPIGLPGIRGKDPAAIAIATAAQLLPFLEDPLEVSS